MAILKHDKLLEQSIETGNQNQIRQALRLAFAVLLTISCGIIPGLAQPTPTATVPPAPTATLAIPVTGITPTTVPPSVSAIAAVPCLTGPGDAYELVVDLQAGEKADIVGKSEGFWVVKTAAGVECWVAEESVTAEGEVASVPDIESPPTPAPAAPAAPVNLHTIGASCSIDPSTRKYINDFHLAWQDMSDNEAGFRVYRDGNVTAEVVADRTDVIDTVIAQNNRTHVYYVTAYNEVGESKSEPIALTCEGAGGGGGGGGAPGPGPGPGPGP